MERRCVADLLEKAAGKRLVKVVAGAGYGKTEAVYSFLKKNGAVVAWVQLSELDNLGSRFWEDFTHSVSSRNRRLAGRLADLGFPDTDSAFDKYLNVMEDDLNHQTTLFVVFDDFHFLKSPLVLRFIESSLNVFLPNITTIIISRQEPAINTTRLSARGWVFDIDENHLRFSQSETARYFLSQNIKLSDKALAAVHDLTGGWAFAVSLTALSIKKNNSGGRSRKTCALSAMKQNIFAMIEKEIFSALPERLQTFLIKLSLVEHLSLEFIKTLSPDASLIEELGRASSFIRYDSYQNAYRIHHLLLEYLAEKQALLSDGDTRQVYANAIQWCVDNNYKMDAVTYCEKAGDYEKIIDVLYSLPLAMPTDTAVFLLGVFRRIPQEAYDQNGAFHVARVRLTLSAGYIEEGRAYMTALAERFEALPDSPYKCRVLLGIYNNLGFLRLYNCLTDHDYSFWQWFGKSASYRSGSGFVARGPITDLSLPAYVCRVGSAEKGCVEAFTEAVEKSISFVSVTMSGCMYGLDDLIRAETAYYRADLRNCEQFARRALYKAREKKQNEIESRALYFLLKAAVASGRYPLAQEACNQLERQLDRPEYVNRRTIYDIVTGWYYLTIRQPDRIASWLKSGFGESGRSSGILGLEEVVKARYYMADRRYREFLALIKAQTARFGMEDFLYGRLEVRVSEALCLYRLKEYEEAMCVLETAYEMSLTNDLYMQFADNGNDMCALAESAAKFREKNKRYGVPSEWLEKVRQRSATYAKNLEHVISEYKMGVQ